MRYLLLLSLMATMAGAVIAGCGDDPGFGSLPYPYPPDAAYDGISLDASPDGP